MNTTLKYKKALFEKRVNALETVKTLKDAVRFFVHMYNLRDNLEKELSFRSDDLANEATLVFGYEIEEYDIMYVAELLCDLRPQYIVEIRPASAAAHRIVFAKNQTINAGDRSLLLEETDRHFNPDSKFYEDVEGMIE